MGGMGGGVDHLLAWLPPRCPPGMRVIMHEQRPHLGAAAHTDIDGHRITAFAINAPAGQPGTQLPEQATSRGGHRLAQVAEIKIQLGDARERMIASFRSREAYIRALAQVAKQHQPTRSGCSCRRRDCETFHIIGRSWIHRRINKLERSECYDEYDADTA
jgi:hypothetical protein